MSDKDTTLWKEYVDSLAGQLTLLGDQASAFGHPTLTGDAREQAVRGFFEKIVPESVGITSGQIFDWTGTKSTEIDVILYDRNFPVVKIGNDCLVPTDAAVALFEVKSRLDGETLQKSLHTCRSVATLKHGYYRLTKLGQFDLPQPEPTIEDMDKAAPGFYVYGFRGYLETVDPLRAIIANWIQDGGSTRLMVPRVIATPTCLGVRKRDDIRFSSDAGPGDILFTATIWPAAVNVLVADLLEKIARRVTYLTTAVQISQESTYRSRDFLEFWTGSAMGRDQAPSSCCPN